MAAGWSRTKGIWRQILCSEVCFMSISSARRVLWGAYLTSKRELCGVKSTAHRLLPSAHLCLTVHPFPTIDTLLTLHPLTTSSAKRMLSSSGFGMGPENSRYCNGWLSRRSISGRSLPPKQQRKPRPWGLLLRRAMVTAGWGGWQAGRHLRSSLAQSM